MADKKIKANCNTCEFKFGDICAGHGKIADEDTYGFPIKACKALFPKGCDDYGISLKAFIQQEKINGR